MLNTKITLVVASKNPVKIAAAQDGFKQMFPELEISITAISVSSDVSDQPMSDEETLEGAINRVNNAYQTRPEADFWIGLEGGVAPMGEDLTAFAWIVVRSKKIIGKARTGTFFLPGAVAELVDQGIELGIADDMVFGSKNSKQAGGAIGLLTQNVLDRKQLYQQAVLMALVPFLNQELYSSNH